MRLKADIACFILLKVSHYYPSVYISSRPSFIDNLYERGYPMHKMKTSYNKILSPGYIPFNAHFYRLYIKGWRLEWLHQLLPDKFICGDCFFFCIQELFAGNVIKFPMLFYYRGFYHVGWGIRVWEGHSHLDFSKKKLWIFVL